jgi:hypothetical protein
MHAIHAVVRRLVGAYANESADPSAMPAMEVEVGSRKICLSGLMSHEQAVTRIEEHLRRLEHTTVSRPSRPPQAW